MTLRLFALRHRSSQRVLPQTYPNKQAARAERDRLNAITPDAYCVTYGPDHRLYRA